MRNINSSGALQGRRTHKFNQCNNVGDYTV